MIPRPQKKSAPSRGELEGQEAVQMLTPAGLQVPFPNASVFTGAGLL